MPVPNGEYNVNWRALNPSKGEHHSKRAKFKIIALGSHVESQCLLK